VSTARQSDRNTSGFWKVQRWLGEHLIEEHIAPPELAQVYADAIRLRIAGLSDHRLRCVPASINELAYPDTRPYDPRD
jgi:hypothetical protein